MAKFLTYKLTSHEDDQTAKALRWSVTADGMDHPDDDVPMPGDAMVEVKEGVAVTAKAAAVDDVGNVSAYGPTLEFVAADTLPPAVPGQPAVELVSERDVPDAA